MSKVRRFVIPKLTEAEQEQLAQGLAEDFQINITRFDDNTGEPILTYEDAQTLVRAFCQDIAEDETAIIRSDNEQAHCQASITLKSGQRYARTGLCIVGEGLGDGATVTTTQQAVAIAMGRAYRQALRAINFNPVRAYRQSKAEGKIEPPTPELGNEESNLRKRFQALAKESGLMRANPTGGEDRTEYRKFLMRNFGVNTSLRLNAEQLTLACNYLNAEAQLIQYQQRAAA